MVPFLLRESGQRVGVFATRYPGRPNPLALSLVRVLAVQGQVLHFAGLDLCHRTPVLDVKPWEQHLDIPGYQPGLPQLDRIRGGLVPEHRRSAHRPALPEPTLGP